jgi:hypothetical protein
MKKLLIHVIMLCESFVEDYDFKCIDVDLDKLCTPFHALVSLMKR